MTQSNVAETRTDARKQARSKLPGLRNASKPKKASLSDILIGSLLDLSDNSDAELQNEILEVLTDYSIDVTKINEVREAMKSDTFFTSGKEFKTSSGRTVHTDGRPVSKIESLGVQPELQKPRDFNFPPGTQIPVEEIKYWPTRFQNKPDPKNYEKGDLVYNLQEDHSFTVLSHEQQTTTWQSQNHLPAMNFIETIGEKTKASKEEKK
jgi:hypothetical protein